MRQGQGEGEGEGAESNAMDLKIEKGLIWHKTNLHILSHTSLFHLVSCGRPQLHEFQGVLICFY